MEQAGTHNIKFNCTQTHITRLSATIGVNAKSVRLDTPIVEFLLVLERNFPSL